MILSTTDCRQVRQSNPLPKQGVILRDVVTTLPNDFEPADEAPVGDTEEVPDRVARYLRLADIALLNVAREEQRRIKQRIRPSVENYRRLTGRTR